MVEAQLLEGFAAQFPGQRRALNSYEVRAEWRDGALATNGERSFSRWLLPDSAGTRLVGVGADVLSVHVLAPYPGWSVFRPLVDEVSARYLAICRPKALTQVAVRYIDQILVPAEADLDAYFAALPPRLPSQPLLRRGARPS